MQRPFSLLVCTLLLFALLAWAALVGCAMLATSGESFRPRPSDPLSSEWDERDGFERKLWIEGMHVAPDGVDWRVVEREHAERERLRRNALAAQPSADESGSWFEVGSRNQAGQTRCAARGASGELYLGSANGGLWSRSTPSSTWRPLSDGVFGGVDEIQVLEPKVPGAPETLLFRRGVDFFRSTDDGQTWQRPAGFEGLLAVERTLQVGSECLVLGRDDEGLVLWASGDGGQRFNLRWKRAGPGGDFYLESQTRTLWLVQSSELFASSDAGLRFEPMGEVPVVAQDALLTGAGGRLYLALDMTSGDRIETGSGEGDDAHGTWHLWGYDTRSAEFSLRSSLEDFWGSMGTFDEAPEILVVGGMEAHRSTDGGRTFERINAWTDYYDDPEHLLHADVRGIDVLEGVLYVHTDGGTYTSRDRGLRFRNQCLTGLGVGQTYDTLTASNDAELILLGTQDQGLQRGRLEASRGPGPSTDFHQLLSGDYAYLVSSTAAHELVFASYPDFVLAFRAKGGARLSRLPLPRAAQHLWMPPLVADPMNSEAFYLLAERLYHYTPTPRGRWKARAHCDPTGPRESGELFAALAFAPSDSKRAYAATTAGNLLHSEDGGRTWQAAQASPAGPFFPCAILVDDRDAGRVWVAGSGYAGSGVQLSSDGGQNFTAQVDGLPDTLVYDLAFAPDRSGDIVAAAEAGAFQRSTEDGVWRSLLGRSAPATTYRSVESLPEAGILRFGTYGRGVWDFMPARSVEASVDLEEFRGAPAEAAESR